MARLEQVNNKAERKVEEAMLETKKARAELYKFKKWDWKAPNQNVN